MSLLGKLRAVKTGRPGVMGIFAYMDDLTAALKTVRERNFTIQVVYSPTPRHEINHALGLSELSTVRFFTLTGAILGILTGISLVIYTSVQWNFIVSGKPIIPKVPTVVVAFEFCILLGILFNVVGWVVKSRMPKFHLPVHYDSRFTEDRFGILVLCDGAERDEVARILKEAGAEEVHETHA